MSPNLDDDIVLRPATVADIPLLERWDREPHVIAATTDDLDAPKAFGDAYWPDELALTCDAFRYWIAEHQGRPIGAMLIIDPHEEPTHYWGEVEPNLRALDIWIGDAADLGRGYGTTMMRRAFQQCFTDPRVTAIIIDPLASNARANVFYQRLGFAPVGPRVLGEGDECLVHRLDRATWRRLFPGD